MNNDPQYDPNPGDVATIFGQYHRICLASSDMGVTCRFVDAKNPTDEPILETLPYTRWVDWFLGGVVATYTRSAEVDPCFKSKWGV